MPFEPPSEQQSEEDMAKEQNQKESAPQGVEQESKEKQKQSLFSKKIIIFGAAIFIVQFVVFYFLTAKLIIPATGQQGSTTQVEEKSDEGPPVEPQIFLIKDIIINPAGTNGTRFLMTTVGFEVKGPEAKAEIEKKEIEVRDLLNTIFSSKTLDDLADVQKRSGMRDEITQQVTTLLKPNSLTKVYFSKFIIQ